MYLQVDARHHKSMEPTTTSEVRGSASKATRAARKGSKATPTEEQTKSIVSRIDDTVTDQITSLATPLIGLGLVEKGIDSMRGGGKMAVAFLLSTNSTGIEIENVFAQTSNTLLDPLAQALLTGS
jgi:hypothetical protein